MKLPAFKLPALVPHRSWVASMRRYHTNSVLEVLWACSKAEFSFLGPSNSSSPRRTPPSASRGSAGSPLSARRDGTCLLLLDMLWCPAPVLGGGAKGLCWDLSGWAPLRCPCSQHDLGHRGDSLREGLDSLNHWGLLKTHLCIVSSWHRLIKHYRVIALVEEGGGTGCLR